MIIIEALLNMMSLIFQVLVENNIQYKTYTNEEIYDLNGKFYYLSDIADIVILDPKSNEVYMYCLIIMKNIAKKK